MPKIVVTQDLDFFPDQRERLKSLGGVTFYDNLPSSYDEWLERVRGFDVICSGKFGLKQLHTELKNAFVSLRFVGIGWLDKEALAKNNVTVANAPGCNKEAVSEWIIGMIINLIRDLPREINTREPYDGDGPKITSGLGLMKVCVLGAGQIGTRSGKICEAMDMEVNYFRRGDDLLESVREADVIINTLSHNPETDNILGDKFFQSLKEGSYFISVTSAKVFSEKAMFAALDQDILAGVAIDCGDVQVGNSDSPDYIRMRDHQKVMATPHIAFSTTRTARVANDIMIDNIEAWLNGKPQNVVTP